ncbi:protein MIS12 homolog [Centruroides sculpturatus]|uniref:protein MIS12 homolog n=1 Tax=Centruroides sculpturatus TaxID=218467 RepID=UPI000C6D497F|nr:protein MIS12 homolog [Centruroides sculpturatus]
MEDLSNSNLSTSVIQEFNEAEYEAQFFGFPTRAFTDGMYNAIYDYTRNSLSEVQEHLSQKYGDVMTEEEIKVGSESIHQRLTEYLNKAFDKLEVYLMANVLHIPENVILPEDSVHQNSHSVEDHNHLSQEIETLKQKIIQNQQKKAILKQELDDQIVMKEKLKEFSDYLDKMKEIAKSNGIETFMFGVNKANELATAVISLEQASLK